MYMIKIHTAAAEAAAPATGPAAALAAAPATDPWINGSIFFIMKHIFTNEMKNVINKIILLFISIVMVNGCSETSVSNNDNTNQTQDNEWQLVWADEFDNEILDEEKWNIMLFRCSYAFLLS